ncbi:hypothetical protein V866_006913 [Kwoniella sp. B9012]
MPYPHTPSRPNRLGGTTPRRTPQVITGYSSTDAGSRHPGAPKANSDMIGSHSDSFTTSSIDETSESRSNPNIFNSDSDSLGSVCPVSSSSKPTLLSLAVKNQSTQNLKDIPLSHHEQFGADDLAESRAQIRSYESDRDSSSHQAVYTTSNGCPVTHPYATQRAGTNGPLLLQDFHLIDLLSHFDRERIPERVVHAKGSGAHGYWESLEGLEDFCVAEMFKKGSKCPITVRFSTVGGESGSADLARDPRGFAVKFKTSEGNWDFVGNNTPVFFLRDPAKFPHFIHTQKRDPSTHLASGDDSTMFWDYLSNNPESVHQVMILMGDRGIPQGYRFMNGYYGHTLKIVNAKGEWVYAQFHLISDQGNKTFTAEEASKQGPDYSQKDLYEAIERGEYPSWTMKVQTMTESEAEQAWELKRINVFDLTHIWPHAEYPLRDIGRITLDNNAVNYFAEIEQAAYNPAHMIPGIEPSADPVLQSRLFSYPDAHRHRIGANYQQLPVNQPVCPCRMANFQRDGQMAFFNQGARPAYLSSIDPIKLADKKYDLNKVHGRFIGEAVTYLSEIRPEDFKAPRALWEKVWDESARQRFIETVAGHMSTCRHKRIIERQIAIFKQVHPSIAIRLEKATGVKGSSTPFGSIQFNGSHNGYGDKIAANGIKESRDIVFQNSAPDGISSDDQTNSLRNRSIKYNGNSNRNAGVPSNPSHRNSGVPTPSPGFRSHGIHLNTNRKPLGS